jgi:V8-like Glu-specific endopeptidase
MSSSASIPGRLRRACLGAAAAAALLAPSASAQAPPHHAGDSTRTVAEVAAYWTPERMANARPLGLLSAGREPADVPDVRDAGSQPVSQAASPVPFTSFELTDTLSYPNRVNGKVFFTRPGVGNFVCSGTVVAAGNQSTVITAGHCVHDGGSWSTNFAFAPGYHNVNGVGASPYGVWAASDEAAPQPWVDSENFKFDVGAAVIARNSAGQSLQSVIGGRPIAFNRPTAQQFRSHGYPAQPTASHNFDGTRLWACDSSPPVADDPGGTGPATMGIGCDMTGGSSGGGWVVGGSSGYLNGVNSYKYSNQPNLMYGPYFGSSIQALYDFAAAEAPGTPRSSGAGNSVPAVADPVPAAARPTCKRSRKRARRKTGKRTCRIKAPLRVAKKSR